jgi:nitronate monooxygenase
MSLPDLTTRLCRLLGIRHPVVLAGMAGGATTPELVAAVSRAGGLGTLGLSALSVAGARAAVTRARELTDAPVAVNVLVAPPLPPAPGGADPQPVLAALRAELGLPPEPPPPVPPAGARELVAAGLEAGARVVSVGLGDPGVVRDLAADAGAPLLAMVSTVADAVRAVEAGADVIVAQGSEAGGHRSSFDVPPDGVVPLIGTFALVPQVVAAVDVPVVATGGIMDGRGLAAALALGADGVQMGTRFLVTAESGVPEGYRRRVAQARDTDTVMTRAVSGRPARGIRNRLVAALEEAGPPGLGYPAQGGASADLRAAAAAADEPELIALWAGQAAGLARSSEPAERLVEEIVAEARRILQALASGGA